MNRKQTTACGAAAGVSLACCFGLLGFLLGLFGLTTAVAYVNAYGDFVFFPSFAVFATLFSYGLVGWRRTWYSYGTAIISVLIMVWFATFGAIYAVLVLAGALIGLAIIQFILRR